MYKFKIILTIVIAILILPSCSKFIAKREKGEYFWCNNRYLDQLEKNNGVIYTDDELKLAQNGYIYSTLGAIVLQEFEHNPRHTFAYDKNKIRQIEPSANEMSGFQAKSYLINDEISHKPTELVVVISGSNQLVDWLANTRISDKQYRQAVNYFKNASSLENLKKYNVEKLNKIVVTGYSLGGALAGHLGKNPKTKDKINEVWLFNPSPRINSSDWGKDDKFWFAASRNDILRHIRKQKYRNLFNRPEKYADDFYLVDSKDLYAHSRWVLARNMLWAADLAYVKFDNKLTNPAMDMIKLSKSKACPSTLNK